jgi:hypothetical protein
MIERCEDPVVPDTEAINEVENNDNLFLSSGFLRVINI